MLTVYMYGRARECELGGLLVKVWGKGSPAPSELDRATEGGRFPGDTIRERTRPAQSGARRCAGSNRSRPLGRTGSADDRRLTRWGGLAEKGLGGSEGGRSLKVFLGMHVKARPRGK